MTNWIPISRSAHKEHYWLPRHGFEFASRQHVAEILISELTGMIPYYTLGFTKDDDGAYIAVAILGLGGEKNLYTNLELKWTCEYVPTAFRAYPFALLASDDGENRTLCMDEDKLIDSEIEDARPLFAESGELSDDVTKVMEFLQNCDLEREKTRFACQALSDAGVIVEWPLNINVEGTDDPIRIDGLYRVSESALNALEEKELAELRNTGALALAYGHLFSLGRLNHLANRVTYIESEFERNEQQKAELATMFDDSGSLNFDVINVEDNKNEN